VNWLYKVMELHSGKIYWTADIDFSPSRYPWRADPGKLMEFVHQVEGLAPYVSENLPGAEELEHQHVGPYRRASARQRQYTHSNGTPITDIPDMPENNAIGASDRGAIASEFTVSSFN
jgi:hypothetical protein